MVDQFSGVAGNDDFELQIVRFGEQGHQFVFEAKQFAAPQVVGGGTIDGEHAQPPSVADGSPVAVFDDRLIDGVPLAKISRRELA